MILRKVRDAADAKTCLDAAESSGMERAVWARANGVSARSLNAWRLIFARKSPPVPESAVLRLVELVAEAEPPKAPIRVRCGPFSVEIGADFDERMLGRVLAVVASC